jgi:hypothetical protein
VGDIVCVLSGLMRRVVAPILCPSCWIFNHITIYE